MKDVAILTKYYKNYNYGGVLQGVALYRVIEEFGLSCDIISYDVNKNVNPVYPTLKMQMMQYGMDEIIEKVWEKGTGKLKFTIKEMLLVRKKLFDEFMKNVGADTKLYDDNTLDELNSRYHFFISGSDQVWNPNAVRKLYLQDFVEGKDRKISYAASIGRSVLSDYEAKILLPSIIDFAHISVREKTAKDLIKKYSSVNVDRVLDPTMLLSDEAWKKISTNRIVDHKYVLCYFFSDSLQIRKYVENYCKKNNYELVFIPYAKQEFSIGDSKGKATRVEAVGPAEFLSLIQYAEYIFTDSFHGAVFSIVFQKQFSVFERNKRGQVSMNSRLFDLLDLFNLSNRLFDIEDIQDSRLNDKIDYEMVNSILEEEKKYSLQFLERSLEIT